MGVFDAIGGILGGVVGNIAAGSDRDRARQLIDQTIAEYEAIGIPSVEAQEMAFERYRQAGVLTPELEQSIRQQDSELGNIEEDPRLREAQMSALDELARMAEGGGVRLSDRAAAEQALSGVGAADRGRREAIEQSLKERGMYGSGLELASKLSSAQDSATNANQIGLDLAGKAQDQALQAILEGGKLGGNIRSQDFDQAAKIASAQDVINNFNAQNTQGVTNRNVERANEAQKYNLGTAQDILNKNVDVSNQEQSYNKGLIQKQYENEMTKANALATARGAGATQATKTAADIAKGWTTAGAGAGKLVGAAVGELDDDEKKKAVN